MERETADKSCTSPIPFSLLFAQATIPVCVGDQTVGAKTETQTSLDGIVKSDSEEDEDVD